MILFVGRSRSRVSFLSLNSLLTTSQANRQRIAITKEALGFWTVKLFRKMGAQWILFWLWELSFQQDFLSFFLAQRFTIGKALWFKVRDWSLRVRDVQCMDELIFLVLEVDCRTVSPRLLTDFGFPCSKGGPQTIQNLTKQFHPSLTEEEKIKKKEGKGLKFFFLEKRFNTQPIKTRETTWSFNGSHELECSHL
ncbi:unnamed protein product [Brassica rapa]|uniref:Uncharacterized protein n=1 Tax=Brassica campestris TaxID=3711 RepID=A0A8D9LVI1_BRACM|nr:unnamed protein product [Brassica rapa]